MSETPNLSQQALSPANSGEADRCKGTMTLATVRKTLERRGLSSVMNDTKWKRLREEVLGSLPWPPAYQLKGVMAEEPEPRNFEPSCAYHGDWADSAIWQDPLYIEWIRVVPVYLEHRGKLLEPNRKSLKNELIDLLRNLRVPHTIEKNSITIYGHVNGQVILEAIP